MKCPRCDGTGDNPDITPFQSLMPNEGLRCANCHGTGKVDETWVTERAERAVDEAFERNWERDK